MGFNELSDDFLNEFAFSLRYVENIVNVELNLYNNKFSQVGLNKLSKIIKKKEIICLDLNVNSN